MHAEIISPARSPAADELLKVAIAELFSVFRRKYGIRWKDQFEDPQARPVWFASLRRAGITAERVKFGMSELSVRGKGWPPSDEEFITLCRPSTPDTNTAFAEAARWSRDMSLGFSHPAIGAAAKSIGGWRFRTLDERSLRSIFERDYSIALDRWARGESLDVPIPLALPAKAHRRAEPEQAAPEIAKCRRLLGLP